MIDVQIQQNDSLQKMLDQKNNEINDMMATFNEIQEGFRLISEAEGRVTIAKEGEGADRKAVIRKDMEFIQETMMNNRDLIENLRQKLRESTINGEELRKTIDGLVKQMQNQENTIKALREELNNKDFHITELDKAITELNDNVSDLKNESNQKSQTISDQDKQIHTAYYVFGTKSELKEQKILEKGEVLRSNFNKNYFTKIDTRVDKEIKLYSKSAKIKTSHPSDSYTLQPDPNGHYVLRITNPDKFWSTNKYLVILVK
jgi:chromosome segregation ATPase